MKNLELLAELKRVDTTQQQVADAIGISVGAFNMKVNGQREFTLSEVKSIIKALDIGKDRAAAIFFD